MGVIAWIILLHYANSYELTAEDRESIERWHTLAREYVEPSAANMMLLVNFS